MVSRKLHSKGKGEDLAKEDVRSVEKEMKKEEEEKDVTQEEVEEGEEEENQDEGKDEVNWREEWMSS